MTLPGDLRPHSVCFLVHDLEQSVEWYKRSLGCTESLRRSDPFSGMSLVFLALNQFIIELVDDGKAKPGVPNPDPPEHAPFTGPSHFCLQTDDLAAVEKSMSQNGIAILFPFKSAVAGLSFFFIRDFEGNLIQFLQHL